MFRLLDTCKLEKSWRCCNSKTNSEQPVWRPGSPPARILWQAQKVLQAALEKPHESLRDTDSGKKMY